MQKPTSANGQRNDAIGRHLDVLFWTACQAIRQAVGAGALRFCEAAKLGGSNADSLDAFLRGGVNLGRCKVE
jgi:hypothetical protein